MVKHIVMWKLKENAEGHSKKENALKLKERLEALRDRVSSILDIEVGLQAWEDETASDVVLYTSFKNKEGLDNYQKHQAHIEIIPFVKAVTAERRVVDYEI